MEYGLHYGTEPTNDLDDTTTYSRTKVISHTQTRYCSKKWFTDPPLQ